LEGAVGGGDVMNKEEFRKLSKREQLQFLLGKTREENDIDMMLMLTEKLKNLEKPVPVIDYFLSFRRLKFK
jgi:hypothetical protein